MIKYKFKTLFYFTLLFLIIHNFSNATPEFAVWTDNRCSKCHINYQGGGLRTEFGWNFGNDVSIFGKKDGFLKSVYSIDKENYSYFNGLITLGTDFRMQVARSHKVSNPVTRIFPMQATFYLNSKIMNGLMLDGQINIAKKVFQGQKEFQASLILNPFEYLPGLKIGFFQPSIGLKDCDMTSLDRRTAVPDGSEIVIAPDYAEWGFELNYEYIDWLQITAGMFSAKSLEEVGIFGNQLPLLHIRDNPSFTTRILFYPHWLIENIPEVNLGGSIFINGKFLMLNAFLLMNLYDDTFLQLRYTSTNRPYTRKTDNYSILLSYLLLKGVILGVRGEYGNTDFILNETSKNRFITKQIIVNSKIFLIPYFEIIPEYRIIDCQEYRSSRYSLQFHIYY